MSELPLRATDVWKSFSLKGRSLRSSLGGLLRRGAPPEPFWALREVSFDIAPGEAFGIIGSNGAGKSTLLKILAGVMPPTRGKVEACERIAPLIEVGAGFHPELTGRENIYLNGAIMGMTRRQIDARLDAIVAFSGLESFLDLAVKHYSSGMYMRLGFSVAVHVEPQLLLVDEVLAVGDQAFQHACLNRIRALQTGGTAVVLVSHNLFTVTGVCARALLLDAGRPVLMAGSHEVVRRYDALVRERDLASFAAQGEGAREAGHAPARLLEVRFNDAAPGAIAQFVSGASPRVTARVKVFHPCPAAGWSIGITRADGVVAGASSSQVEGFEMPDLAPGEHTLELEMPRLRLVPGAYRLDVAVGDSELSHEYDRRQIYFEVSSEVPNLDPTFYGSFLIDHRWRIVSHSQPQA